MGAFADLYVMGDEYSNAAAVALWCALAGLLLVPLILNFGAKRTLLISAAVWAGMTIAHTIVLIVETSADPTSHNLWPFEYLMLSLVAVPRCWVPPPAGLPGKPAEPAPGARLAATPGAKSDPF